MNVEELDHLDGVWRRKVDIQAEHHVALLELELYAFTIPGKASTIRFTRLELDLTCPVEHRFMCVFLAVRSLSSNYPNLRLRKGHGQLKAFF